MAGYYTESNYENAVLQLINEELGYSYVYGPDVERTIIPPSMKMYCFLLCSASTAVCLLMPSTKLFIS